MLWHNVPVMLLSWGVCGRGSRGECMPPAGRRQEMDLTFSRVLKTSGSFCLFWSARIKLFYKINSITLKCFHFETLFWNISALCPWIIFVYSTLTHKFCTLNLQYLVEKSPQGFFKRREMKISFWLNSVSVIRSKPGSHSHQPQQCCATLLN